MPFPRERRRGRRLVGGILGIATAMSLGLAAPSYADDDYPYRGLGQCPLVPLPPHPKPVTKPGRPGGPGKPTKPNKPGKPGHPGGPTKPGHPTQGATTGPPTPPPPRTCAKHIWYYQGTYGDPWGFALRNCTSFVAWRLREVNGLADFTNHLADGTFGNAEHWDDDARALGYLVDDVPAVGAVAQTDSGRVGHVAWVQSVGTGTVTVEEYNYGVAGGYDVRTVPTSDFRYLHLADVSPAPTLGSTRALATASDATAGVWTARTTHGDLTVTGPVGPVRHVGARGSWSAYAAPSLVVDLSGRVWLAAVTSSGRVLTTHTRGPGTGWTRPRAVLGGPWSTTSSPSLAIDGRGRVRLLTVSASGDLVERHTANARAERWGGRDRMGLPGSWSAHAAPTMTTDRQGRLWVALVTRHGTLQVQHTRADGSGWSGFRPVDHQDWSVTSTPALSRGDDGRLWLTSVSSRGDLVTRSTNLLGTRWQHPTRSAGQWSPYSSPATTVDSAGRLWLAAVSTSGRVVVRSTAPDSDRWRAPHALGRPVRETDSPVLVSQGVVGVRLATLSRHGAPAWHGTGARYPVAGIGGARAGGWAAALVVRLHP
jgi:surface antigen